LCCIFLRPNFCVAFFSTQFFAPHFSSPKFFLYSNFLYPNFCYTLFLSQFLLYFSLFKIPPPTFTYLLSSHTPPFLPVLTHLFFPKNLHLLPSANLLLPEIKFERSQFTLQFPVFGAAESPVTETCSEK
jgi:hypothetical protein